MRLVEAGKLDLSAPVSRYLDNLPIAWRPITIRQLLTHVSGLPDVYDHYHVIAVDEVRAWDELKAMPMLAEPGERFRYTQTNYVLIGKVITKLTGKPFINDVVDDQFAPVGMGQTAFGNPQRIFDGPAEILAHATVRYTWDDISGPTPRPTNALRISNVEDTPAWFAACNGMMSTAGDLARWLIALDNQRLLKRRASLDVLWTPGRLRDGSQSPGFGSVLNGYALGWETVGRAPHRAVTAIGGERAILIEYPDDDLSIVVLTNLMGSYPEAWVDGVADLYFSGKMNDWRDALG
jgi:CubicO group peptidase (beta-lactamase class C family)